MYPTEEQEDLLDDFCESAEGGQHTMMFYVPRMTNSNVIHEKCNDIHVLHNHIFSADIQCKVVFMLTIQISLKET